MKISGYILFITGVIFSAVFAASIPVNWNFFLIASSAAAAGALLCRIHDTGSSQGNTESGEETVKEEDIYNSLVDIYEKTRGLSENAGRGDMAPLKVKQEIEYIQASMQFFILNRNLLRTWYGTGSESDIMSIFSAGERSLARGWSALVDGYQEAAFTELETTVLIFADAVREMNDKMSVEITFHT